MPIYKLEGFAIKQISLRLTDDQIQKLNKLLQKLNIEPLKNGDGTSDKLRLFIDKLYEALIQKPELVTTKSEKANIPSLFTSKQSVTTQAENNQCLYRVPHLSKDNKVLCSRFFLKKGKIIEVDSNFCDHCYTLQQNVALKQKVNATPASPAISTFYKKPEQIYCIDLTKWIDPLKNQARCTKCKLKNFRMWAECQQRQQYAKKSIPQKPKKQED